MRLIRRVGAPSQVRHRIPVASTAASAGTQKIPGELRAAQKPKLGLRSPLPIPLIWTWSGRVLSGARALHMRVMELPEVPPRPSSWEDCAALYRHRLEKGTSPHPRLSATLLAYMAWPEDSQRRNQWTTTLEARAKSFRAAGSQKDGVCRGPYSAAEELGVVSEPAMDELDRRIRQAHVQWPRAADVLHMLVDMTYTMEAQIRGGPSVAKAIEVLEISQRTPSQASFRLAWSKFGNVAHLIAAAAFLADSVPKAGSKVQSLIFNSAWLAPDAVLSLAAGFQKFGLEQIPHGRTRPFLTPESTWRIPVSAEPVDLVLPRRRLTAAQIQFLTIRRARKK